MGEVLLQRYEVIAELGSGGMGAVYRCHDRTAGLDVAVKAVCGEDVAEAAAITSVRQNFLLIEKLHHPNIAGLKTLERDPRSGLLFVVMEYVPGLTLDQWQRMQGGRVSMAAAAALASQIAAALDYAHSERIIHRDLKPSNIMVTEPGRLKVLDFGIADRMHATGTRFSTAHFDTSGTRPYMAPEQWRGEYQNAATDQYALAAVIYEMVAGHPPFTGADVAALREAVLEEAPTPPPGITPPEWKALRRGLAKQRTERYPSCTALVDALCGERRLPALILWGALLAFSVAAVGVLVVGRANRPAVAPPVSLAIPAVVAPGSAAVTPPPSPPAAVWRAAVGLERVVVTSEDPFPERAFLRELGLALAARGVTTDEQDGRDCAYRLSCSLVEEERVVEAGTVAGVTFTNAYVQYRVAAWLVDARNQASLGGTSFTWRAMVEQSMAAASLPAAPRRLWSPWREDGVAQIASNVAAAVMLPAAE